MRIDKPWGYEYIFAANEKYAGKIFFIKKGFRLSKQFHKIKDETIYLNSGEMELLVSDKDGERSLVMKEGDSFRIEPGVVHRMTAVKDCFVFEVSTAELDDVVRLEDDYGRRCNGRES